MRATEPLYTVELFPPLSRELITLLQGRSPHDWTKATACGSWNVKQVALHLLGGSIGRLSDRRVELLITPGLVDTYAFLFSVKDQIGSPDKTLDEFEELTRWINHSNAEWVRLTGALDTNTLIAVLGLSDAQVYQEFKRRAPDAMAGISVVWAGESQSFNWFDIAREYGEKWLHQQHIREAWNEPVLDSHEFLHPVLDTLLRAIPYTYRDVAATNGTALVFHITGRAGGDWSLVRESEQWVLYSGSAPNPTALVSMDQDIAWRLFTKGVSIQAARSRIQITGDPALGAQILHMVSIMA